MRRLFLLLSLFLTGCGSLSLLNRSIPIQRGTIGETTIHQGFLTAGTQKDLFSPFNTKIRKVVEDGTQVQIGDILCELVVAEQKERLEALRAETAILFKNLERASGSITLEGRLAQRKIKKAELILQQKREEYERKVESRDWLKIVQTSEERKVQEKESSVLEQRQKAQKHLRDRGFSTERELLSLGKERELLALETAFNRRLLPWLEQVGNEREIFAARQELEQASQALFLAAIEATAGQRKKEVEVRSKLEDIAEIASRATRLENQIASAVIRAEAPGILLRQKTFTGSSWEKINEGDQLFQGFKFLSLLSSQTRAVEVFVDQRDCEGIQSGTPIVFYPDAAPEMLWRGQVTSIGKMAEDANPRSTSLEKLVKIKAALNGASRELPLGYSGTVEFFKKPVRKDLGITPRALFRWQNQSWEPTEGYSLSPTFGLPVAWDDRFLAFAPAGTDPIPPDRVPPGRVISPERKAFKRVMQLPGEVRARSRSILSSPLSGKVAMIKDDGSQVKPGEAVARIDTSEIERELADLEIQIKTKKEQLDLLLEKNQVELPRYAQKVRNAENALTVTRLEHQVLLTRRDEDAIITLEKSRDLIRSRLALLRETLAMEQELARKGLKSAIELMTSELEIARQEREEAVTLYKLDLEVSGPTKRQVRLSGLAVETALNEREIAGIEEETASFTARIDEETLRAELARMETDRRRKDRQIKDAAIHSPQDGIVILPEIMISGQMNRIKVGDQVYEDFPFINVADLTSLEIRLEVPETDRKFLHPGKTGTATVKSAAGKVFSVTVNRIAIVADNDPQARPESQIEVFLSLASGTIDPAFRPGVTCEVEIPLYDYPEADVLPLAALVPSPSGPRGLDANGQPIPLPMVFSDGTNGILLATDTGSLPAFHLPTQPLWTYHDLALH